MSTIIDDLKISAAVKSTEYVEKLKAAGFPHVVPGYGIITKKAIEEYLISVARKATGTTIFGNKRVLTYVGDIQYRSGVGFCVGFHESGPNGIRFYIYWRETPVSEFPAKPPIHVLDSIKRAKKDFKDIRIVTIEQVVDPLVVGVLKGDNENRYLIDWWGEDIDPSEIEVV